MIEANVRKSFGNKFSLDAFLRDENFISLTGKNGSGKSTFLKIIAGILKPDSGYVKINSVDVTRLSIERRGVVLVDADSYLPQFKVESHLLWGAKLRRVKVPEETLDHIRGRLGITFRGPVGKLSTGMRMRVSIATAVLSRPSLILLDEVFSSVDNYLEFIQSFKELTGEFHIDVIYTSQSAEELKLAEHQYVMDSGKMSKA